jgi:hypothetical protein
MAEIKFNTEEIKGVVTNYYNAAEKVFNEGLKFLKDFLENKGFYSFGEEYLTISTDVNPFSQVNGIFVKNGVVLVSCDDDDEYELYDANAQDIANIVKYVLNH